MAIRPSCRSVQPFQIGALRIFTKQIVMFFMVFLILLILLGTYILFIIYFEQFFSSRNSTCTNPALVSPLDASGIRRILRSCQRRLSSEKYRSISSSDRLSVSGRMKNSNTHLQKPNIENQTKLLRHVLHNVKATSSPQRSHRTIENERANNRHALLDIDVRLRCDEHTHVAEC